MNRGASAESPSVSRRRRACGRVQAVIEVDEGVRSATAAAAVIPRDHPSGLLQERLQQLERLDLQPCSPAGADDVAGFHRRFHLEIADVDAMGRGHRLRHGPMPRILRHRQRQGTSRGPPRHEQRSGLDLVVIKGVASTTPGVRTPAGGSGARPLLEVATAGTHGARHAVHAPAPPSSWRSWPSASPLAPHPRATRGALRPCRRRFARRSSGMPTR